MDKDLLIGDEMTRQETIEILQSIAVDIDQPHEFSVRFEALRKAIKV